MLTEKTFALLLLGCILLVGTIFPSSVSASTYQVQSGDSMFFIAQRFGTTVDDKRANGLSVASSIPVKAFTCQGPPSRQCRECVLFNYEVDLIARMIHAEAGAEPLPGQGSRRCRDPQPG